MARRFTRASTEQIQFSTSGQHFTNWPFGTIAVWINAVTSGVTAVIFANNNAGNTDDGFAWFFNSSNQIELWCDTAGNVSICTTHTVSSSDGWCLLVITKATGSAAPRSHLLKAGAWSHANYGTALVDNASVNLPVRIGGSFNAGADLGADIAALMALPTRVMSDSECERLASGGWSRWTERPEDFLVEFPSGRDSVLAGAATSASTWGRGRMRSTTVTGTSRTPLDDPPGFRFSPQARRR